MTATSQTYSWIKQIPRSVLRKDEIPLLGFPPAFPWEQFSQGLGKLLEIKDLTISPKTSPAWRTESELFAGMGPNPQILNLSLAPEGGVVSWVISRDDLKSLMELTLLPQAATSSFFDNDFGEGFYKFLAIESLQILSKLEFDPSLSFQIASDKASPHETSLCMDVSIVVKGKTFWGRFILSPAFHKQWKARYIERALHGDLEQSLNLILHLEAGRVAIAPKDWESIKPGDFLLLDACSMNPESDSNQVKLTIHGLPLFAAEIADEGIHLLEYSQYQEGDYKMAQKDDPESPNNEESEFDAEQSDDELDLDESELEEFKEAEEEPPAEEEQQIEEEVGETEEAEAEEEEVEEDFDDLSEIEEEGDEFEKDTRQDEKWPPLPEKRSAKQKEAAMTAAAGVTDEVLHVEKDMSEEKPQTLTDVPLPVIIEVGRIQMSLGKLMELQPGNMLDLKVHPESGVDLVVNGRRIARGELLLIGETLGVRILEMG